MPGTSPRSPKRVELEHHVEEASPLPFLHYIKGNSYPPMHFFQEHVGGSHNQPITCHYIDNSLATSYGKYSPNAAADTTTFKTISLSSQMYFIEQESD